MPKPRLTAAVINSIESLLSDLQPTGFLDTDKEAGVRYMTDLVKHYRDPKSVLRRRKEVDRTRTYKKGT